MRVVCGWCGCSSSPGGPSKADGRSPDSPESGVCWGRGGGSVRSNRLENKPRASSGCPLPTVWHLPPYPDCHAPRRPGSHTVWPAGVSGWPCTVRGPAGGTQPANQEPPWMGTGGSFSSACVGISCQSRVMQLTEWPGRRACVSNQGGAAGRAAGGCYAYPVSVRRVDPNTNKTTASTACLFGRLPLTRLQTARPGRRRRQPCWRIDKMDPRRRRTWAGARVGHSYTRWLSGNNIMTLCRLPGKQMGSKPGQRHGISGCTLGPHAGRLCNHSCSSTLTETSSHAARGEQKCIHPGSWVCRYVCTYS